MERTATITARLGWNGVDDVGVVVGDGELVATVVARWRRMTELVILD